MGAANWDATVNGVRYDFRSMTTPERKGWYGKFMGSVRRFLRGDTTPPSTPKHRPRRGRAR